MITKIKKISLDEQDLDLMFEIDSFSTQYELEQFKECIIDKDNENYELVFLTTRLPRLIYETQKFKIKYNENKLMIKCPLKSYNINLIKIALLLY